jgi:hypothetical protein
VAIEKAKLLDELVDKPTFQFSSIVFEKLREPFPLNLKLTTDVKAAPIQSKGIDM